MKIASAAVFTTLVLFLLIVDMEQGNPMVRVIKDPSSLDFMRGKKDVMDYEDLNGQVRGFTKLLIFSLMFSYNGIFFHIFALSSEILFAWIPRQVFIIHENFNRQAGAELCQAQFQLG